jgi:c-di-GMP-related signal transduction protein
LSTTESPSHYDNLEHMSVSELLTNMNKEDQTVPIAVSKVIPNIEKLVKRIVEKMKDGGRCFIQVPERVAGWALWMLLNARQLMVFPTEWSLASWPVAIPPFAKP